MRQSTLQKISKSNRVFPVQKAQIIHLFTTYCILQNNQVTFLQYMFLVYCSLKFACAIYNVYQNISSSCRNSVYLLMFQFFETIDSAYTHIEEERLGQSEENDVPLILIHQGIYRREYLVIDSNIIMLGAGRSYIYSSASLK